jgi:hypothetical protein
MIDEREPKQELNRKSLQILIDKITNQIKIYELQKIFKTYHLRKDASINNGGN